MRKFPYKVALFFSISLLVISHITILAYSQSSQVNTIHENAWSLGVEKALADPYYKYGIYASRTIMVRHPEAYLQADRMFLESVDGKTLEQRLENKDPTSYKFDFGAVDLDKYEIVSCSTIYKDMPYLPNLDQRAFSLSAVLRRYDSIQDSIVLQNKITQLGKAILYYLKNTPGREVYLVLTDKETAYVIDDGVLLSAERLKKDSMIGNPILIFNEKSVWYPLMDRDDAEKDASLKTIVNKFSGSVKKPSLTKFEDSLLEDLKAVTSLANEYEVNIAILSGLKTSCYYGFGSLTLNQAILNRWMKAIPSVTNAQFQTTTPRHPAGGVDDALIDEITKRASYLSPITAYLASKGNDVNFISRTYKQLGMRWSSIWTLGMVGYTIDESLLTSGGECQVHASNIASVLDTLKLDNYVLHGNIPRRYTHQVNYVPSIDALFSNGMIQSRSEITRACPRGIMLLSHNEKWALIVKNNYVGDMSPLEARQAMLFLKSQHNEDLKGLICVGDSTSEISLEQLTDFLEKEQIGWKSLGIAKPMPQTRTPILPTSTPTSALTPSPTTESTPTKTPSSTPTTTQQAGLDTNIVLMAATVIVIIAVAGVFVTKRKKRASESTS